MMRSLLILILQVLILTGCNIFDDPSQIDGGTSEELKPLGDMGYGADQLACNKNCYSGLVSKEDTSFIINSAEEYDKLKVKAMCLEVLTWPEIDFSKQTLLAGIIITPTSCCKMIKEELVYDPFVQKYTLTVTLFPGLSDQPAALFFWGLSKKLSSDASVEFKNKYNTIY